MEECGRGLTSAPSPGCLDERQKADRRCRNGECSLGGLGQTLWRRAVDRVIHSPGLGDARWGSVEVEKERDDWRSMTTADRWLRCAWRPETADTMRAQMSSEREELNGVMLQRSLHRDGAYSLSPSRTWGFIVRHRTQGKQGLKNQ